MNHLEAIEAGAAARLPHHEIARKIYLTYPTKVFIGEEERQYRIFNDISINLDVPITSIHVAGSAKTGRSFHKKRDFVPGGSDLDIAIIDARLFAKYMESVLKSTRAYSDRTGFPIRKGVSTYDEYIRCISKGMFRPDLMPSGPGRADWSSYFGKLSTANSDFFRSINAAIYLSQGFFEQKQRSSIANYLNSGAI